MISIWQLQTSTFFTLMAEFGTGDIPLHLVCNKYFGISDKKASQLARIQSLPVPVFRGGSQKSMWLVNAVDLAKFIDKQREKALHNWERLQGKKF